MCCVRLSPNNFRLTFFDSLPKLGAIAGVNVYSADTVETTFALKNVKHSIPEDVGLVVNELNYANIWTISVFFRRVCDVSYCARLFCTKLAHFLSNCSDSPKFKTIQPVSLLLALTLPEEEGEGSDALYNRITNPRAMESAQAAFKEEPVVRQRDDKWKDVNV